MLVRYTFTLESVAETTGFANTRSISSEGLTSDPETVLRALLKTLEELNVPKP